MPALRQRRCGAACISFLSRFIQRECLRQWRLRFHGFSRPHHWSATCQIEDFAFGSIRIDGITHEHDVVIEDGEIRKRKKKASKKFRKKFGHTPLSVEEDIPWKCRRLVIGTGAYGKLPMMTEVKCEAERHKVELVIGSYGNCDRGIEAEQMQFST